MLVYKATNIITNKSYIGKTIRTLSHAKARHKSRAHRDWKIGCESKFYNSIRYHGWDAFVWEVMYIGTTDEDIQEKERLYINDLDTLHNGYNSTPGGDGGAGKTLSDSHKEKLAIASTGSNNPCYGLFGADHPAFGNKHTETAIEKIKLGLTGVPKTEEHKRKLSEAKKRISRFSQSDYEEMIKLRHEGFTYANIASRFNTSGAVIYKIFKRETTSDMRQSTPSSETLA